jgi:hypothetical protein
MAQTPAGKPAATASAAVASASAPSPSPTATAHLDRSTVAIGQSFHLIVDYSVPSDSKAAKAEPPPADSFTFDGFDVRDAVRTNQPDAPGLKRYRYDFELVGWEAGKKTVPPIDIDGAQTASQPIELTGAQQKPDDKPNEIRGNKPLVSVPIPPLWIVVGAIVVLALLAGTIWSLRQLLKRRREVPPPPPIPPHVWALQALDQLWARHLVEDGKHKEYYESLTAILRTYLERRFDLPVMERTTAEVLADMRARNFAEELRSQVRDVLDLADLVKFARLQPGTEGPRAHWTQVRTIVEHTKPAPQPAPESAEPHLSRQGAKR